MKQNNKTMLIDRYISGKLEDTELWEFKTNLEKDVNLAREVKLRKEIYNAISNEQKMDLLKTLSNIKTNKSRRTFRISLYSKQVQAFAASIVILIAVGAGLLSNYVGNTHESNYDIYNSYFVDEGSLISNRSDVSTSNSLVESGITLYDNKKYSEAISMFDSNPENVLARLYSGLAYMKLEDFEQAEKQFRYILNHGDNILIDQAEWNLGLSYLAENETEQASSVFTKIASKNGAYYKQAGAIINELKNN